MKALATALVVLGAGFALIGIPTTAGDQPTTGLSGAGAISRLSIEVGQSELAALRLHPRSYVKATVREGVANLRASERQSGGEARVAVPERGSVPGAETERFPRSNAPTLQRTYREVGLHLKGNVGTFQPFEGKPSLTLNFDKFVSAQKLHGLDKLHLNNSVSDPTFMTEVLCRELFEAAGVPVGRAGHARVELNGRDAGLYVVVEGYNKAFLKRYFENAKGHLYDSEFMHDITEPLKASASGGPADRADLKRLAEACEEVLRGSSDNNQLHLSAPIFLPLNKRLDMDRFYSFLAVEIMTCHFDGYARGINNYWVYHDPGSDKMVFIPHGMDQMFHEPQGSLFPELKGLVAKAVLESAEGRRQFRERCVVLFTNLFPRLTNRVEESRKRLRPELARMGANAVLQHERAVADLQDRVRQRCEHLRKHLLAPAPGLTTLSPGREATLTNALASVEQGPARLTETVSTNGTKIFVVRLQPQDKPAVAEWETRVLLPKGEYRVEARITADQGIFRGPDSPATLKLWGGEQLQFESLRQDPQHLRLRRTFKISSEGPEEILIQCQFQSAEEAVTFQVAPLRIMRIE